MSARSRPARSKRIATALLLSAVAICGIASSAHAAVDANTLRTWGLQTYNETDRTLRVPNTRLFAETANLNGSRTGGFNGRAFVWPMSTQFRVFNALMMHDKATYAPLTKQFSDQLRASYWDTSGYRAGALPGTVERFYDDNAHLVVALAEAHKLTGDIAYLNRAIETQAFVMSGEDNQAGGGIYFKQAASDRSKNTISTLQGARGAAMLYQATGNVAHLNDAKRLITWAKTHVQMSNGLFYQGYNIDTSTPVGVDIVNGAATGISANLAVYAATNDVTYLFEARRIALAASNRFVNSNTDAMGDEGFWAFELVDAFNDLSRYQTPALWQGKVNDAMVYLHDNMQDTNGHYDTFWGRNGPITGTTLQSWDLNEMAPVARAYLYSAAVLPEPGAMAVLGAGTLLLGRRRRA